MKVFGKRTGGGRRSADRRVTPLPCLATTVGSARGATLQDVSSTGARLCGTALPKVNEQLVLKVGAVEAFAVVRWAEAGQCGIAFEKPLSTEAIASLEREAEEIRLMRLTPDQSMAMQQWVLAIST